MIRNLREEVGPITIVVDSKTDKGTVSQMMIGRDKAMDLPGQQPMANQEQV